MLARFAFGILIAGSLVAPALADTMNADEARKFVANKLFSFNCFDGTKGMGKILDDGSALGSVQFGGSGQVRHMRLPTNTLQVRGQSVCAAIKGMPFEPCFNLSKYDEVSFRGSVSGLGFAYCDFRRQGTGRTLLTRVMNRTRAMRSSAAASSDAKPAEAAHAEQVRSEPVAELRKSKTE